MSENKTESRGMKIALDVDCGALDAAIEKANRLVELLHEAAALIDSLYCGHRSEP